MEGKIFNLEDEKNLNVFSKIIYVVSKILYICSLIGMVCGLIGFVALAIVMPNVKFNTDNSTVKIFSHEVEYKLTDEKLIIDEDNDVVVKFEHNEKAYIEKYISLKKVYQVLIPLYSMFIVILSCFVAAKLFKYLERFFRNVYNSDTPFIEENIEVLQRIVVYFALILVIPDFALKYTGIMFDTSFDSISIFDFLLVIFICCAFMLIYKNGCELQVKVKEKKEAKKASKE